MVVKPDANNIILKVMSLQMRMSFNLNLPCSPVKLQELFSKDEQMLKCLCDVSLGQRVLLKAHTSGLYRFWYRTGRNFISPHISVYKTLR